MAFAVVCKSCQSRFLLNDDLLKRRVAGRVVTVRCRQCHASIEVDASQVDTQKAAPPEPEAKVAAPEPVVPRALALKAPSPPRPTKSSTLIGIGGPPRPPGSTELVALSPGLLHLNKTDATSAALDFPEPPPPPPSSVPLEELNADDWEIAETPPLPKADSAPESVDDFIEELPPSIPPSADDEPTALIPARELLQAAKFAEASANREARASRATPLSVDLTSLDVPLENPKSTLPLFGLEDGHAAALATAPKPPTKPKPPSPSAPLGPLSTPSPAEGSLSPASLDPPPSTDRPDSARTRKNVVAPATSSVPPAADRKRSGLAIPIVAGLAIAAGVLIYKRGEAPPPVTAAQSERPAIEQPAPVAATEPTAPAPATTSTAVVAAEPGDDMTFETAPSAATPKVAAAPHHEPTTEPKAPASKSEPAPKPEPATAPAGEPAPAIAKTEPSPREPAPTGPVGDFDPSAAAAALTAGAAQASACRKEGDPSGVASVVITFAPSGRVTSANVSGPPFAGTPTGGCIAAALRKARVPAFDGDRVTVSKTIVIQ